MTSNPPKTYHPHNNLLKPPPCKALVKFGKLGIPIMKTLTGLNRQWLLKTVLSTSMIVTVSVPQSSVTNIAGSKQEKSKTTLFQTKIIANPSGSKSPEGFSL